MNRTVILAAVLALRLLAAEARASSPEQLIDEYVATGAIETLERSRVLAEALPRGFRSRLLESRVLLLSGRTEDALRNAKALNRDMPDELDAYAVIVEGALKLHDLGQAERAAEWMLRLRPDDARSLRAGAAVREALKDHEGAEEMLLAALLHTPRQETAQRAAIGVNLARVKAKRGRIAEAASLLDQIDKFLPAYVPAAVLRRQLEVK